MINKLAPYIGLGLIMPLLLFAGWLVIKNLSSIFNRKKIVDDYTSKAKLRCTSETSVFSTPPESFCILSALENGLEIKVILDLKARTEVTYLLSYTKIHKIYYDKEVVVESTFFRNKLISRPDHIIVEYIADDGSVQQLRFQQTEIDKNLNSLFLVNQNNSDPGFRGLINARIQRETYLSNNSLIN